MNENSHFNAVNTVFFDVVGTLLFPEPPASRVYFDVGKKFGSRLDADEVRDRFRKAFRRQEVIDEQSGWRTSAERERRRWQEIVAEVFDDLKEPGLCFETLYRHFANPDAWRIAPDVEHVFEWLEQRKMAIGLASNYDERLRSLVDEIPMLRRCRHIAISAEIGWRKPAGKFFQSVVAMANVKPSQILFVGDDWHNDIQGGRAAGLRTFFLQPNQTVEFNSSEEFHSLGEICRLLDV